MHARVTTVSGSPDNVEAGIEGFCTNVLPLAREEGKGAILLVDRENGGGVAITLWEDEQASRAGEERANAIHADAAEQMAAAQAPSVNRYEVAVFEV